MDAKSAVVVNGGVRFKVFDKFYAELAKWNRFRLVQRKEDADITILMSSTSGELFGGIAVPTGGAVIGGSESKFYMRISNARDGMPLWTDVTEEAGLVSNSGKRLVSNLRKRMGGNWSLAPMHPHMETLLHFYAYGKPKETVEQTGPPQRVVIRIQKPW
jgi:hypothetical protein